MPAPLRIARRSALLALVVAVAALTALTGSASAAAPAPDTSVLTICPALGTAPVTTLAGERACVSNDCASIAFAATGSTNGCTADTVQQQWIMSSTTHDTTPATPGPITGSFARVLPAEATTSVTTLAIRALIGVGVGALLLAAALAFRTQRTPRTVGTERAATRQPAEVT
ncbi:MAG: hypothetical protein JWN72_2010 [Thermoleophilia bacterium]|nr:hypothetical protein [Thermoleophilia bacterium]